MKSVATMIADIQLDLHGCEYHESQQLTHIDGFLVYYNGHGRLTVSQDLTEQEKLLGVQRLLSQLEHAAAQQPQLYFWTRGGASSTQASSPALPRTAPPLDRPAHACPAARSAADPGPALPFLPMRPTRTDPSMITLLSMPGIQVASAVRSIIHQPPIRQVKPQEEHTLLEEETATGQYASLSLHVPSGAPWSIVVRIVPPMPGRVHLTLGSQRFQAPLAATGTAMLEGIAPELLLDAEGPDLELLLEQTTS